MAEMMKQGGMPGAKPMPPGGIVPSRDIKPLAEQIDALLAEEGGSAVGGVSPGTQGETGAMPGTGGMAAEPAMGGGAAAVAEMLGVSMDKAQQLLDAAMSMPAMAGKSPEEIAQMLASDMNLRMQVEKNIGAGEDMKARESMSMARSAPPPMEPSMSEKK